MSEADWWLCDTCQSLNNLSARRCYSCRRRKPKRAQRASQHLGYRVIMSWDGKVRLEQAEPPQLEIHLQQTVAPPPPLRAPVPRSIADLTPRPPQGARITYWLGDPARDPRRRASFPPYPGAVVAVPIEPGMPPPAVPAMAGGALEGPPPSSRPVVPMPVGSGPAGPNGRPLAAIPIVPSGPSFPHWQDLLDVPRPDPARLRQALGSAAHRSSRATWSPSTSLVDQAGSAPTRSSDTSDTTDTNGTFVAWPAVDLASRRTEPGPG
jgi:hypothetical protein